MTPFLLIVLTTMPLTTTRLAVSPLDALEDPAVSTAASADSAVATDGRDTLVFVPAPSDADSTEPARRAEERGRGWMKAPRGDGVLTEMDGWLFEDDRGHRVDGLMDYDRVDRLRIGLLSQYKSRHPWQPQLGGRIEYTFDRQRTMYGVEIQQPLNESGRVSLGFSMVRATDHNDLQQVGDVENSLALLFNRQDYRDYFEREGLGGYLRVRIPHVTIATFHVRNDEDRSLPLNEGTRSWFNRDEPLRDNPAIDDGEIRAWILRFERTARPSHLTRAGLYHQIDIERAGGSLGGDFGYGRVLVDVRNVLRLSPASTLTLRVIGGHRYQGTLPFQKEFVTGGIDGLRAHSFDEFRGDQMALAQTEYTIGLWPFATDFFEGGMHAIVFFDAGTAWFNPDAHWDLDRQHVAADGGFGLSTSEDNVRIYFAKNLQDPSSDFVVRLRLQRPF
jgi:Omp85 superfamily domain